jgi:hypothetical protein
MPMSPPRLGASVAVLLLGGLGCIGASALAWVVLGIRPPSAQSEELVVTFFDDDATAESLDEGPCRDLATALVPLASGDVWAEARRGSCVVHAGVGRERVGDAQALLAALSLPSVPVVGRHSEARSPALTVVIEGDDVVTATTFALDTLRPRIERLEGVAAVEVCGVEPVLDVRIDPDRARALGVTTDALEMAFATSLVVHPGAEVGHLPLTSSSGNPVRVSDVGAVEVGIRPRSCTAWRSGADAVAIQVWISFDAPTAVAAIATVLAEVHPPLRAEIVPGRWQVVRTPVAASDRAAEISARLGPASVVTMGDGELRVLAANDALLAETVQGIPGLLFLGRPEETARIWVAGPDREAIEPVGGALEAAVSSAGGSIAPIVSPRSPELVFELDAGRAARLGIDERAVRHTLALARGIEVAHLVGEDERPVVLHVAGPALDDPLGVAQLFIENVPLTSIASFRMAEPAVLHRRAGRPARGVLRDAGPPRVGGAGSRAPSRRHRRGRRRERVRLGWQLFARPAQDARAVPRGPLFGLRTT